MKRILPLFESLSEFVAGLNGDCGPDAALFALHAMAPNTYPLTAGALAAIDHAEIVGGYAAANGAQNVPSMDAYLASIGVPHVTRGYNSFALAQLHTDLQQLAGIHPIIIEFSQAGDGLPQDERNVKYHYATIGGIDDQDTVPGTQIVGGYLRADGDAVATNDPHGAASPAVLTSWQQLLAAVPIAYIIVTGAPTAPAGTGPTIPQGWHDDGTTLTAPNGVPVVLGFRTHILSNGWASDDLPLAAQEHRAELEIGNPSTGAGDRQLFRFSALGYTDALGVFRIWIGQELANVETALAAAETIITQERDALASEQQQLATALAGEQQAQQALTIEQQRDAAEEAAEAAVTPSQASEPAGTVTLHVMAAGETLQDVAKNYYGDASRAAEIAAANGLPTPDSINAFQVVRIP